MKFSPILSAKSLALASALVLGAVSVVSAQGYDQGGSTQKPGDSMQSPGTSGGSDYGTKKDDQGTRYESNRDNSRYSTDGTERYDDKDLHESSGTDGTGPRLKGRY